MRVAEPQMYRETAFERDGRDSNENAPRVYLQRPHSQAEADVADLYTIIIISSIVKPGMWLLILLLALFRWVGISFYMRGEFYREKSKDYVAAAIAQVCALPSR